MMADEKGYSGSAQPPGAPAAGDLPPSYDASQSGVIGGGGFQAPPVPQQQIPGYAVPAAQQQQPPPVVIQYVGQTNPFGPDSQEMTCPKCQARVRTTIKTEPGVMAWIIAGVLCVIG